MVKKPKTKKPADVIGNAARVIQIDTGEVEEEPKATAIARGENSGKARAEALPVRKRREIAKKAAEVLWNAKPTEF